MSRRLPVATTLVISAACSLLAGADDPPSQTPGPRAPAKAEARTIVLTPRWVRGDARTYERVKSRRRLANGKVTSEGSGRGDVDVSVDEATEDGFLVRWVNHETKSDTPAADQAAILQDLNQLVAGMVTLIEMDPDATVTGIRNWKDAQKKAAALIETLTDPARLKGLDPKMAPQLKAQLSKMFGTKEQVEQLFLREPELYFMPIGRSLTVGAPVTFDDKLPNPLGGPPLPSRAKLTLTEYDATAGRAVVTWDQTVDPGAGGVGIDDHAEYVIDARTGWIDRFTHIRSIRLGPNVQEDLLSMTSRGPTDRQPR